MQQKLEKLTERLDLTLRKAGFPARDVRAADLLDKPAAGKRNLPDRQDLALLAFDADSIQSYVLASPRPVTIAGASKRLQKWDEALNPRTKRSNGDSPRPPLDDTTVLFAGGGNATLLVPAQRARDVAIQLRDHFIQAVNARATIAWINLSPRDLVEGPRPIEAPERLSKLGLASRGEGFGACMARLSLHLRLAKEDPRPPSEGEARLRCAPTYEKHPEGRRCGECALRPAQDKDKDKDGLCQLCRENRREGRTRFQGRWGDRAQQAEQARSFAELFEEDAAGRMAYVFIDGRGIGSLLAKQQGMKDYVQLSWALDEAFNLNALDHDARRDLGLERRLHQRILCGGDDLLLVVPATPKDRALPDALKLTQHLLDRIEQKLQRWARDRAGAGAGVVITKTLGADLCFDYARDLCRSAKALLHEEKRAGGARSALDFAVLLDGSPLSCDIQRLRDEHEQTPVAQPPPIHGMTKLCWSQRPYALPRLERLLQVAEKMQAVPRSQLNHLYAELCQDPSTALVTLLYQVARTPALREALGIQSLTVPEKLSEWALRPRPEDQGEWETALGDLLDVLKVVRP